MSENTTGGPHGDWNQVGAAMTTLGERIQAHFAGLGQQADQPADSPTPFEQLGKSLDDALSSFRAAVDDPGIADAAKSAADEFLAALKVEVGSAGSTVSETLGQVTDTVSQVTDSAKQAIKESPDSAIGSGEPESPRDEA